MRIDKKNIKHIETICSVAIILVIMFLVVFQIKNGRANIDNNAWKVYLDLAYENMEAGNVTEVEKNLSELKKFDILRTSFVIKDEYDKMNQWLEQVHKESKASVVVDGLYEDGWMDTELMVTLNDSEIQKLNYPILRIKAHVPDVANLLPIKVALQIDSSGVRTENFAVKELNKGGDLVVDISLKNAPVALEKDTKLILITDKYFIPSQEGINEDSRKLSMNIQDIYIIENN